MTQDIRADRIVIQDLDGSCGVSFCDLDPFGNSAHYFCVVRNGPDMEAQFNATCNTIVNQIPRIGCAPGVLVVHFAPGSMRKGNIAEPHGESLETLTLRFNPVIASADLESVLRHIGAGHCTVERLPAGSIPPAPEGTPVPQSPVPPTTEPSTEVNHA